ncbi:Nostrin [Melipona quadrifasciata]|uniref:Nostrin n=1 Tax=Melipona quadrifasciata TaxID=166423 RepID=A0A0M8ZP72_9HYME|nr:Nostrin [Melipona quadrifasciata]
MTEAKHAWATLKLGRRLTLLNNGANTVHAGGSTTIWYDVPAPVIVHCCQELSGSAFESEEIDRSIEKRATAVTDTTNEPSTTTTTTTTNIRDNSKPGNENRHRNTVELTAVTSVKTDDEGVPRISFSFLQADDESKTTSVVTTVEERTREASSAAVTSDENDRQGDASTRDQLYDFPRNSYVVLDEIESEKVVESSGDERNDVETRVEISSPEKSHAEARDEPPKHGKDSRESQGFDDASPQGTITSVERASDPTTAINGAASPEEETDSRSNRSCRGRVQGSDVVSCRRGRYPKRHRLEKAWEKMRSWLREETSRINDVVNKHARLQAVGALAEESCSLPVSNGNSASYDLTRARTRQSGSILRVEEFGLSSVSEENLDSFPSPGAMVVSSRSKTNLRAPTKSDESLGKMVASSDNLLNEKSSLRNEEAASRAASISLSMDKLCSDAENDETRDAAIETIRDHARNAGLIKRRMLGSIRGLMASTHLLHSASSHEADEGGQGGFEDVRRYVKQGGDFCKELASILHERAELEAAYAKGLSKLSNKLTKACAKDQGGNGSGGVNEAWRCVGEEMEAAAEAHRIWGITLSEQIAKPLRVGVAEAQGRSRKSIENSVDKAGKSLHEWRNIATKSKKQSFACARENERLQDLARLQSISQSQQSNNKSSTHHMTEKEASKLETRRRKAEDSSRRADTEFYTVSVRAERARLEYESTVRKGAKQMELLEEERLSALKDLANVYLAHLQALAPRLQQSADRLAAPIRNCNVSQDIEILKNLIRRVESNEGCNAEQLLPDFYAEHVTLAMNRERRKQALIRVLHLIRQDLERERRGREGLETLHRAFIATPAFAADESTQNVTEKLLHMRSMLLYLEAARYKVGGTLAEVEGSKRDKHPLAEHILVSRDKQGLQQSVLKIPSWAKNESFEIQYDEDEMDVHLVKDHDAESRHWADRTAGDGNSENPPDEDDFSDFDEFSSHSEDNNNQEVDATETSGKSDGTEQCRAIYQYSANLNDELSLSPGDLITVHQKQPDGWWIGECRGRTGIFPATYVQVIH